MFLISMNLSIRWNGEQNVDHYSFTRNNLDIKIDNNGFNIRCVT